MFSEQCGDIRRKLKMILLDCSLVSRNHDNHNLLRRPCWPVRSSFTRLASTQSLMVYQETSASKRWATFGPQKAALSSGKWGGYTRFHSLAPTLKHL